MTSCCSPGSPAPTASSTRRAEPQELFEAIRVVARGGAALPPLEPEQLEAAAHRIDPEDLALLAMLVDGTPADAAADTLRLDRRKVGSPHRATAGPAADHRGRGLTRVPEVPVS